MENSIIQNEAKEMIFLNKKHEWFRLTKKRSNILLIYLNVITILSFCLLVCLLIKEICPFSLTSPFSVSIVGAISTSLLGSGIYYSRKLYKACINLDMIYPIDNNDTVRQLGVTAYYLSRPLYSASLSLIACVALKSGSEFITSTESLNENYPYVVMVISFFVGYSSGDLIDDLETKGKSIVGSVIKKNSN